MTHIVLFQDNPDAAHQRAAHMDQHVVFLAQTPEITRAGPLFEGPDGAGGLWLVETDDPSRVEALVRADPFFPTGLRHSWTILRWQTVWPRSDDG